VSSSPTERAPERLLEIVMPQLGITVTEGTLVLWRKKPGDAVELQNTSLHFRYSDIFAPLPEAYETLLLDVLKGDPTLFVRDDWVEDSWQLYTPLLQHRPPLYPYAAGSWGPAEADELMLGVAPGWSKP